MAKQYVPPDEYYPPVEYHIGNIHAKVYHPILTEEEYNRRMEKIKKAAADLLISIEMRKAQQEAEAAKTAEE